MTSRRHLFVAAAISGALAMALAGLFATSHELREPRSVSGSLEPVTVVVGSGPGGTVSEVLVREGETVRKGQPLVRLDAASLRARCDQLKKALRLLETEEAAGQAFARLPDGLRSIALESHPDVVRAENDYVRALESYQRASPQDRDAAKVRLDRAARERTQARLRIAWILGHASDPSQVQAVAAILRQNLSNLEGLLAGAELRAPCDGAVDILRVKPGDRLLPASPVAMLIVHGEYSSDFAPPDADIARLQPGMRLKGKLLGSGTRFAWRVDSITKREIPAPFRENRDVAEQMIVHARVSCLQPFAPGARAEFELP
jgi:multidrug resistance efflux pump